MAEKSQDELRKKGILDLPVSKRTLLKAGIFGAGIAVLKPLTEKPGWMKVLDSLDRSGVAKNEPKEIPKENFEEKFFHNLTGDEQKAVDEKIESMKGNFDDHEGKCQRIAQYEDLITAATEKYSIPKELLVGLIFAESGGNPMAVSEDAGAKGITQVMDFIADAWSKDGSFNYSNDENDDRFNVPKVLDYSCRELSGYFKKFQDWGLAFWAWHAGEPRVYEAVRTYFQVKEKIDLGDILSESDEARAEEMQEDYRKKIKTICVDKLLSTLEVRALFKGDEWNRTDEYCYRICAGAEIYLGNKLSS